MLMRHPEHGWHNATSLEVSEMKKNGWIESSYQELEEIIAEKVRAKNNEVEPIREQLKRKPGPKPKNHNVMENHGNRPNSSNK